jgi:MSHA pilin protein MshD
MSIPEHGPGAAGQRGLTLIELVVFIVVVSVGVAGILSVMNLTTSHSADPLVRKQALAAAEALLEEIELQSFTDCDPDYYHPDTGTCDLPEAMGPEPGETRGSFDNVNDYYVDDGFVMAGISTLADPGTVILPGYTAKVVVSSPAGTAGDPTLTGGNLGHTLHIVVTVTGPDNDPVTLDGYRTRYAPKG